MIKIKKEELIKYYITENHSIEETSKFFNCGKTTIKKFIRSFNIHKDKKLISKQRKNINININSDAYKNRANKIKETLIKKYGVDNPMKIKEFKEKAQKTNLEKYGSTNPNKNKDVLNKRAKTNLEKYGHACCLGNKEIQKKAREKCIEKYGDKYPLRSNEYRNDLLKKRKETNLEKYGCEEITTSEYFRNKVKEKCLEKYGTTSPNESIYSNSIFSSLDNFKIYLNEKKFNKPTINDLMKDLSLSDTYLLKKIHNINADDLVSLKPTRSSDEKEIFNFLINELNISKSDIVSLL